jgi:SAM-dependent methyltransferase
VSIELARRGVQTLGVDLDESMLRTAVDKAPELRWCLGDLSVAQILDEAGEVELFDVILAAGNVMIFLEPGTEQSTVYRLADHLVGGGVLIAGFQLGPSGLTVLRYDELCRRAGLELTERYSTWARDPFGPSSRYAVSVHRRPRY